MSLRFGLFLGHGSGQVATMLDAARCGWFPVPGDAHAHVSFIDIDDAARAVHSALTLPAGADNAVEDEPAMRAEHAAALAAVVGRAVRTPPGLVGRLPIARPLARALRASNHRLRTHGWAPRVPRLADDWGRAAQEVAGVAG